MYSNVGGAELDNPTGIVREFNTYFDQLTAGEKKVSFSFETPES
jgi:hypothetical protein